MERIKTYDFPNGMRLLYIPTQSTNDISCIQGFIPLGSIHETPKIYGGAHVLEHMLFQGTTSFPSQSDVTAVADKIGAYINAYTEYDLTSYFIKFNAGSNGNNIEDMLYLMFEILWHSLIHEEDFKREKKVVIEELIRAFEEPDEILNTISYREWFKNTPMEHPIGAYMKNIENIGYNDIVKLYRTWYHPQNTQLVVSTHIPFEKLIETIHSAFQRLPL